MIRVKADVDITPEAVKSIITTHYGLEVLAVEKVRGVYKVETPRGMYGFKNAKELLDLPFIADCLRKIRENGFKRIPDFIFSKNDHLLIHQDRETYFMEEWLDLREVPRYSYPYLKRIGIALADFHLATRTVPAPSRESPRYQWGLRHAFLEKCHQRLLRWRKQYACVPSKQSRSLECFILDYLLKRCRMAYQHIQGVSSSLIDTDLYAAVWCHGGLHPKNIMLDKQENIWLIDFETMVYSERVMDLAQLLQYHASTYYWHPHVVHRFLRAYNSRLPTPISRQEWQLFLSYLTFPRRFHTRMMRYFNKRNPKSKNLQKLKETVEKEMIKENFLKHFIRYPFKS